MKVAVSAVPALKGKINLPASKSYSIRAFIIAACGGRSHIINPSDCDDAIVAQEAARALGARIVRRPKNIFEVTAFARPVPFWCRARRTRILKINVKESGTVLRFMLPLLAFLNEKAVVTGEGTLKGRPNAHLVEALRRIGIKIQGAGPRQSIPIRIQGGLPRQDTITIDGSLSSQFISAILIAGPLLKRDIEITITGRPVSETYITMTEQVLKRSGVRIRRKSPRTFLVKANERFHGLKNFIVPSDYGLAAYFLAAAALVPSHLILKGDLKDEFIQADGRIFMLLKKMGVRWQKNPSVIKISGPFDLKGGEFSLKDCPDLVPIMAVLALFAKGRTRLFGIEHARIKESDRIGDLKTELLKVGAKITDKSDELIIDPLPGYKNNVVLDPHHDHRLAMAFCIIGLKLAVSVKDIECTRKSYPGFLTDLRSIGARIAKA